MDFLVYFPKRVDWYAIVSVKANKTSQGAKGIFLMWSLKHREGYAINHLIILTSTKWISVT